MTAPAIFPGKIVAGKYRVERLLGEGGHGVVVAAQHLALGDKVAIKVLRPELAMNPEVVGRFLREARAAVRIKGDHVTRVLDVGSMEDGAPYMVMEHLLGHDLRQLLGARSRLSVPDAVDYVLQSCEALAEAHAIGIVHRDVKPENLFLTRRADGSPWIKVLDFGISKAMPQATGNDTSSSFTQTQNVVGSPQYMAPEQMSSPKLIDARTDIWGLGVTLYELLAGTPPFTATTLPEVFAKILRDPPPISRSDVPRELQAVIARCLDKDVRARYATVVELARALAPFSSSASPDVADRINRVGVIASQSGNRLPETSSHDVMQAFDPGAAAAAAAAAPAPPSSSRTAAIAGAVFGVVALVGIVLGLRLRRASPETLASDSPPAVTSVALAASSAEPTAAALAPPPPLASSVAATPSAMVSSSASPVPVSAPTPKRPSSPVARPEPKPAATPPTKPAATASSRYD